MSLFPPTIIALIKMSAFWADRSIRSELFRGENNSGHPLFEDKKETIQKTIQATHYLKIKNHEKFRINFNIN